MIRKFLLVRKNGMNSTLMEESGLLPNVVSGKAIPISPLAWREEDGFTHYGYVLEMKFKGWQELQLWISQHKETTTILDMVVAKGDNNKDAPYSEEDIDKSLAEVGLKVHDVE